MIDMTINQGATNPATGCGCVACGIQVRSVGAQLDPGGDTTNMVAWVNAFDITTVPWGQSLIGLFSNTTETTPDSTGYVSGTAPINFTECFALNEDETACVSRTCPIATVYRSEFYLPLPTAYYVLAYGASINVPGYLYCAIAGGNWLVAGCIYPQQSDDQYPMIVSLPIPDYSLADTILVNAYYLGIINPACTGDDCLPDLSSLTIGSSFLDSLDIVGIGPNWSASIANPCYASPDDPFSDSDPP